MNKEKMVRSENKGRKEASRGEREAIGCVCCKMDVKRERVDASIANESHTIFPITTLLYESMILSNLHTMHHSQQLDSSENQQLSYRSSYDSTNLESHVPLSNKHSN